MRTLLISLLLVSCATEWEMKNTRYFLRNRLVAIR